MLCPECQSPLRDTAKFCDACGHPAISQKVVLGGAVSGQDDKFLGRVLDGDYEILSLLGSGSMGRVYKARQLKLGYEVAIKLFILRAIDDEDKDEFADFLASLAIRFRREAQAMGQLNGCPNIATIYNIYSAYDDVPDHLVMEFVRGESLRKLLKHEGGRLPLNRSLNLMQEICIGVGAAHDAKIIHRDLKPGNIIVVSEGQMNPRESAKVVDFGLVKVLDGTPDKVLTKLTDIGSVMGTLGYMAPERWGNQANDPEPDARSDVYSLGVMLYEMLAGQLPFSADSMMAYAKMHLEAEVPPFDKSLQIPSEIERVIQRALAKKPEERQADANMFAKELVAVAHQTADAERLRQQAQQERQRQEQAQHSALVAQSVEKERQIVEEERQRTEAERKNLEKARKEYEEAQLLAAAAIEHANAAQKGLRPAQSLIGNAKEPSVASQIPSLLATRSVGLVIGGILFLGVFIWFLSQVRSCIPTPLITVPSPSPTPTPETSQILCPGEVQKNVLSRVLGRGYLIMGVEWAAPPMNYSNDEPQSEEFPTGATLKRMRINELNWKREGLDYELATMIAEQMGLNKGVKARTVGAFDELFCLLNPTEEDPKPPVDIIMAGIVADNTYKGTISWSKGYLPLGYALVARKDSNITSLEDCQGKKIGIVSGDNAVKEYVHKKLPNIEIKEFEGDTVEWMNEAIHSNDKDRSATSSKVDAIIYDQPFAVTEIKPINARYNKPGTEGKQLQLKVQLLPDSEREYSIGIPKGNDDLRDAINNAIDNIKQSPQYLDLLKNYLQSEYVRAIPAPVGSKVITVKRGDTLSQIALDELGDAQRWREIRDLNNLANDYIYPGNPLTIPPR